MAELGKSRRFCKKMDFRKKLQINFYQMFTEIVSKLSCLNTVHCNKRVFSCKGRIKKATNGHIDAIGLPPVRPSLSQEKEGTQDA